MIMKNIFNAMETITLFSNERGQITISGIFNGCVCNGSQVFVTASGVLKGEVRTKKLVVDGIVEGKIETKDLVVGHTGKLYCDKLQYTDINAEEGALISVRKPDEDRIPPIIESKAPEDIPISTEQVPEHNELPYVAEDEISISAQQILKPEEIQSQDQKTHTPTEQPVPEETKTADAKGEKEKSFVSQFGDQIGWDGTGERKEPKAKEPPVDEENGKRQQEEPLIFNSIF